jgi:hypothetical protein
VEYLDGANALAKQVLSQLSYTPTAGTTFILRHLREFQKPFLCFSMNCVKTVSKALPAESCCVKTPDISWPRRLIFSSTSLFICENFLNLWESI